MPARAARPCTSSTTRPPGTPACWRSSGVSGRTVSPSWLWSELPALSLSAVSAGCGHADVRGQLAGILDGAAVELDDHITRLDAGVCGGTVRHHLGNERS